MLSRDMPDDIIVGWQVALDDMKTDGTFSRFYSKWLPGVNPPGR